MNQTKLNKNNFLQQVTKFGFFAEQFPHCFTSEALSDHLSELVPTVKTKKNITAPSTLSTYKNDISRRIISVPNPEAFLRLAIHMKNNWSKVMDAATSKNSLSPIFCMNPYYAGRQLINCESLREAFRLRSDFLWGIKQSIRISLGYKYRLKVDIANCYNSMYTHSITWAVCGKALAKTYYLKKEPPVLKPLYDFADNLDIFTRYEKNNETNGIIVGPYTSRIVSEIILARIDKMLAEKGYKFKRYVDDYKFYFRTEFQAQESLHIIEKVFNEYNLALNVAKTEIQRFPYEVITDMKERYANAFFKAGVLGILNEASLLHLAGQKGAYKYALKYLRGKPFPNKEDLQVVIPTLFNIMLLDPRHGKYITDYLISNRDRISLSTLQTIINEELQKSLESELQQESLLFIQLLRDLDLIVTGKNVLKILQSDNDFAIIIALDIWKNRKSKVQRNSYEAYLINQAITNLIDSLKGEKLTGSRWLLLYEIDINSLVDKSMLPIIEEKDKDNFFKKMYALKISFYKSVKHSTP